jgi:hypothetical protein
MSNLFNIDINRIVTAAVGALVLSTACIGAAVAPARAVETDTALQFAHANAVPAGTQAAA